jgi:pimeloyl-ACP methyl ester carboxylesterase
MSTLRTYGSPPFAVAVLHGGPGALGSMAAVARTLAAEWGVLEPLQDGLSIGAQVEELRAMLDQHADPPVMLVGSSWGAMLGLIFAAQHPALVRKLILVGSGPLDARYAAGISETRLGRLSDEERHQLDALVTTLDDPAVADKSATLAAIGALSARADGFDPIPASAEEVDVRYEVFQRVWAEAAELRAGGGFRELARRVTCPVVAIHGDYDPHPAAGVRDPLAAILPDFRFISLERCGHEPWIERHAREEFYRILRDELRA